MNRKQKVAIVLGALVIAGLALFPPWVEIRWRARQHPFDSAGLQWVLSDPNPEGTSFGWRKVESEKRDNLQLAALALTVAAVLVLKERKA